MIFISDNCSREKGSYTVKSTLERKGKCIITDTIGTSEERSVDRVYKAWKEDFYGEVSEVMYMRLWFEDWRVVYQLSSHPPPDWISKYHEQQTGH